MRILIPILLVICFFGCVSADREHGVDGNCNDEKNAEVKDSEGLAIFDFSKDSKTGAWKVEDDVVMGGRSKGSFSINQEGNAVFSGTVSLENNGGFSSVQYYFDPIDVTQYRTAVIRLKGDGKRYQFIVESGKNDRHYYVYEFQTGNDWQTVVVPLAEMYPVYRGERLDIPKYPGQTMSQVRFLIANEKPESFSLEIDKIWLE
jgi:NADH dehydrogenase [ubiquinone] 1 alpha subcomplex assembly factor 1